MPSFAYEHTVVTTAAETLGERRGRLVPEILPAHAQGERKHESGGCISFPTADVLCSNLKFLASCHSLCLYSWIQSECFREFPSKHRRGCNAGYLSALMKVGPRCLFSSKLLLSNQTPLCVIFFSIYYYYFIQSSFQRVFSMRTEHHKAFNFKGNLSLISRCHAIILDAGFVILNIDQVAPWWSIGLW